MEKLINIPENFPIVTFQQEFARRFSQKKALEWAKKNSMPYQEMMIYFNCALMEIENDEPVLSKELRLCADMASELDTRLQKLHAMIDGDGEMAVTK